MIPFKLFLESNNTDRPAKEVREDIRVALKELKGVVRERGIKIKKIAERDGDGYDQDNRTILLSKIVDGLNGSKYMSALFTLAHEFGHSKQHEGEGDHYMEGVVLENPQGM